MEQPPQGNGGRTIRELSQEPERGQSLSQQTSPRGKMTSRGQARSRPSLVLLPLPTDGGGPDAGSALACPRCRDAGYLRADVPVGHPNFGKAVACTCQQARKNEARRQLLRAQSQLDTLPAFREASFATFDLLLPGVEEAYEAAEHFAQKPEGWLVLEGDNGCGKTHLAVAIAKHCLEEGLIVLFAVVPDLLDYLRATFAPQAEEPYDSAFTKMKEAQVLILDDLGSEQSTSWANEKLFQLLNFRSNARLPTVITTNKIGLAGIENRLRSRLFERRLVRRITMAGARDYRLHGSE